MSPDYESTLRITARKHDVIGIHVYDQREAGLTDVGLLQVTDPEHGNLVCIDTSALQYERAMRAVSVSPPPG